MIITHDMLKCNDAAISSYVAPTGLRSHIMTCQYLFCLYAGVPWIELPTPELSVDWAINTLGPSHIATFCTNAKPMMDRIVARYGARRNVYPGDLSTSTAMAWCGDIKPHIINMASPEEVMNKYDCQWHVTLPIIFRVAGRDWSCKTREALNPMFNEIGRSRVPFNFVAGNLMLHPEIRKDTPAFSEARKGLDDNVMEMARRITNRLNEIIIGALEVFNEEAFVTNESSTRCRYCRGGSICPDCVDRIYAQQIEAYRAKIMPIMSASVGSANAWHMFLVR